MTKHLLPFALAAGLLFFGYQAYDAAKPEKREKRVYEELKVYIPYKIEKRVGGLSIISTLNDTKEKPPATQVYKRLDQLEKIWGKEHLRLDGEDLLVLDKDKKTLKIIKLENVEEMLYIKNFFEL